MRAHIDLHPANEDTMDRRPPSRLRSRRAVLAAGTASLAIAVAAAPVLADCIPAAAAFPPGDWVARGITLHVEDSDQISTLVMQGDGRFNLHVSDLGVATGHLEMAGVGDAMSFVANDSSGSQAIYSTTADLEGTGTIIQATGQTHWQIEGAIDVHTADDGPDPFSAGGRDLFGFGGQFELPFQMQFSPSASNCNMVVGDLGGHLEYGVQDPSASAVFVAIRVGGPNPKNVDLEGQLAEIMESAEVILDQDPIDTDSLSDFLLDVLSFDALLTASESCDMDTNIAPGHPVWAMLQSVFIHTLHRFLSAADGGAYETRTVIGVMGTGFQSGLLGWRDGDCVDPSQGPVEGLDLLTKFEDVLLERLGIAFDNGLSDEIALITAAAYQYGLDRVLDAMGKQS